MKLLTIHLDDKELPETVDVQLTALEAAVLVRVVGATSWSARDDEFPGWGEVGSGFWDCLSAFFNAFYEDGVRGYFNG